VDHRDCREDGADRLYQSFDDDPVRDDAVRLTQFVLFCRLPTVEAECVIGVAEGLTRKQIADRSKLSVHTVNTYLGNAKARLNVETVYAILERGWSEALRRHGHDFPGLLRELAELEFRHSRLIQRLESRRRNRMSDK